MPLAIRGIAQVTHRVVKCARCHGSLVMDGGLCARCKKDRAVEAAARTVAPAGESGDATPESSN